MRRAAGFAVTGVVVVASAVLAEPARARFMIDEDFFHQPTFELLGPPPGQAAPPAAAPAHLAGSTIAAVPGGALAIDADSGQLVRVDADGKVVARVDVAPGAGLLVVTPAADRAYVADRAGDRIVVVDVTADALTVADAWATPREPWGLALSPDGATLLVTAIADRRLVAIDTATGATRWDRAVSREPRGVAIAPDGAVALVTSLVTGTVERIDLAGEHAAVHVALGAPAVAGGHSAAVMTGFVADDRAARSFARGAFAARFVGHGVALVGYPEATPVQDARFRARAGSYGGGSEPPIDQRLAFVGAPDGAAPPVTAARVITHQPNAIGWDAATDTAVIAGYGSDDLLVLKDASRPTVALAHHVPLRTPEPCGPDGVAVTGDVAWVWCALSRQVVTVELGAGRVAVGPTATTSRRSDRERLGAALFRAGRDGRISSRGALACASCHPDGRADGLSWRIDQRELQTPVLAGRIAGTHPYKWDGGDADLAASLTGTMSRLGGGGLGADEVEALSAYLEGLPPPRAPRRDAAQVARGKRLFTGELGCTTCHGGKRLTDRDRHELGSADLPQADTPSLIGLAASAPYYHDGSAATLEALLRDVGLVHGMAELDELTDAQIADLVAYLETL